jgi:hypothetical protein
MVLYSECAANSCRFASFSARVTGAALTVKCKNIAVGGRISILIASFAI